MVLVLVATATFGSSYNVSFGAHASPGGSGGGGGGGGGGGASAASSSSSGGDGVAGFRPLPLDALGAALARSNGLAGQSSGLVSCLEHLNREYNCDICGGSGSSERWACRRCNFDMCQRCGPLDAAAADTPKCSTCSAACKKYFNSST